MVFLLCGGLVPPEPPAPDDPVQPLPQDTGAAGLQEMLLRLHTTARLMQVVAHPDDEDGGMLTLESRGRGATVLLQTLNRGEGGQNKIGSNLFDVLGVLRTLELTAADRYYGVQQRFTRVADFGFSKTADETFQKWQGHDIALGDLVRVIRTFRPDVLIARFTGTPRDGHGHHQASSILAQEAFKAAADPNRFPEQIKEGLQPWQVKKVYTGNACGFGATTCEDATVRLNTGEDNPALGMSYLQFAMKGLKHQLSQGAGSWSVSPGPHYAFYKLVDSVLPATTEKNSHEKDLFDGIDTSLPGVAGRVEAGSAPFLGPALVEIEGKIKAASAAAEQDPASAAVPLLTALEQTHKAAEQVQSSRLNPADKAEVVTVLNTKAQQLEQAANLALGVELTVATGEPAGSNPDTAFMAVPGTSFELTAKFSSKTRVVPGEVLLDLPAGWTSTRVSSDASGAAFRINVPKDAAYTRPYWHRDDPETEAINQIDDPRYVTLPFRPPPVQAHAGYRVNGEEGVVRAVAMVRYKDPEGQQRERTLAAAPAFSVALEPGAQVIPMTGDGVCKVKVAVFSNLPQGKGRLQLEVPSGWRVEPVSLAVDFHERGQKQEFEFKLFPANLQEGRTTLRAVFESGGVKYSEGYSVVTREDLDTSYYYQPAVQRISVVDVKVPRGLKVAYVMGAGDDIPPVLKQIGMNVTLVAAEQIAQENLGQYQTIVLGIRAYDTQKQLFENKQKLLDFVSSGGTLVVQYNASAGDFNAGKVTPYPAELSRARVSVEEAPVQMLSPDDAVFHSPNTITAHDFDGWVQERGLYFMDQWDDHFTPLLACHDPGEPEQKGGLLRAQYGKGNYIYTGYAFFRQLPAGVPGAIRLFVNLLAAGQKQ